MHISCVGNCCSNSDLQTRSTCSNESCFQLGLAALLLAHPWTRYTHLCVR
jgi:hypothetical protein